MKNWCQVLLKVDLVIEGVEVNRAVIQREAVRRREFRDKPLIELNALMMFNKFTLTFNQENMLNALNLPIARQLAGAVIFGGRF
jgi:hypothetical protein